MKPGDLVFLDSGVVGLLTHPRGGDEPRQCRSWALRMLDSGVLLMLAEVIDYEIRREMIRLNAVDSQRRLDRLRADVGFTPITSAAFELAAHLWAKSRQRGRPTGPNAALDVDVLHAAQAIRAAGPNRGVMVATANVRHYCCFLDARPWEAIAPADEGDGGTPGHLGPLLTAHGQAS